MTLLGEILLEHYAGATDYADQAVIAAVEELEKHADTQPDLVFQVERAMVKAGKVNVPFRLVDDFMQLTNDKKAVGEW